MIYFIKQIFEENILWMTSAANYLWTICIIFLAMYPYIKGLKLSVLIMVASPSYPSRACFGSLVFLLVPILKEFNNLKNDHSKLFYLIVILDGAAFIMNMFSISLLQIVRNSGVYIPW